MRLGTGLYTKIDGQSFPFQGRLYGLLMGLDNGLSSCILCVWEDIDGGKLRCCRPWKSRLV